ncbi:MAG: hypothetical protein II525_01265 [Bacteroidales bacterium]|nr:hypothetical protein [Bacteroidales bacterium]
MKVYTDGLLGVLTIHTANTPRKYIFEKTDKYETWFPNNFLNTASNEDRYISELKNRLEVDEVALVLPIRRFEGTVPKSDPKSDPKKSFRYFAVTVVPEPVVETEAPCERSRII